MTIAASDDLRIQHLQTAAESAEASTVSPDAAMRLLTRYYRDIGTDDLLSQRPDDLLGAAFSHRDTGHQRRPGEANVRVFTPTVDNDGWSTGHTVVEIVTDDMPFLVDSVSAELTLQGRTIHLLVHPQLVVRRDETGTLVEMLDADLGGAVTEGAHRDGNDPEGALVESWIHIQIGRESDAADREHLAEQIRAVLADVRVAVEDWPAMTDQATAIAENLAEGPPRGLDPEEVAQGRALLEWLANGHFVFLGYREYLLPGNGVGQPGTRQTAEAILDPVPDSGLGLLREDRPGAEPPAPTRLTGRVAEKAREPRLLIITKANSRSRVHRPVFLDYIGVKTFDETGAVVGERRFLGLFTASAYNYSVTKVPFVSEKVRRVIQACGFAPDSHLGKDLLEVLETYPRDELFATDVDQLTETALAVVHLAERRRTRLFLRKDDYGRFMSCLVYLPRDRYNTAVRQKMEAILKDAFNGSTVEHTTRVSEAALAMLHFVVRVPRGETVADADLDDLEHALIEATRTWDEEFDDAARAEFGEEAGAALVGRYGAGFPESYKERYHARVAVSDLRHLEALEPGMLRLNLYKPVGAAAGDRRLKLYRQGPLSLTSVLPVFNDLGVEVTDERPYEVRRSDDTVLDVYDFGLHAAEEQWSEGQDGSRARFQAAFEAVWEGRAESDGFNSLVLRAGLDWRQVVILRALAAYLRQGGWAYSRGYLEEALRQNHHIARMLVELFETRFDPDRYDGAAAGARATAEQAVVDQVEAALDEVSSLDQDRILRAFVGVIQAMLRTNYFQHDDGTTAEPRTTLAFKLDPHAVPNLPAPRPKYEIWVYGPGVEGVHLRFGAVARGGLRWSDRREDFRTEILGLVKAQMVKNAVIVPTGSKGGFVAKRLPDPAVDRDAWLAEGKAAYAAFVSALLEITDNRLHGAVVPPERLVRHDGDDPYLVVAADKGTATFSDLANGVAQHHGYWLDDAFASGGSAGYDHKAMGITARGAWESVRRHFREMGHDTQSEDFTVVGIGDMSGDVFGNGMLLSEHIRLVAAFDHRHVFLDPDPDPSVSFAERRRLFDLPRSSWADYDEQLLSEGGGVYPRTAKSVPITDQVRERLGLDADVTALTPAELMSAILRAPVDLLWNGGIGTYVKAATESNAQIGDRANDAIRVDGRDLRCTVVGEGGNLGVSQLGRIEAARSGVRINTDAIDNSAGVDTSDHEVNIKILLTGLVREGEMTLLQRDRLLASMTDDVAAQVLRHNYEQNVLLGNARTLEPRMVGTHVRFMRFLEGRGELDRALEFLPSDDDLVQRAKDGRGLTSPEFAVLMAYSKLALKHDLVASSVADEPWFTRTLTEYFPPALREDYSGALAEHPLRREIIVNEVANSVVNRGGISFVHRAMDETGAAAEHVARAFVVCREIFGLASFTEAVEALDHQVTTSVQSQLYLEFRRLLDHSVRWFLQHRPAGLDVAAEIDRFGPTVRTHVPDLPDLLRAGERERAHRQVEEYTAAGVPAELARRAAVLRHHVTILDVAELAAGCDEPAEALLDLSFAVAEHLGIDRMLALVSTLPQENRWDALARGALRDDLHAVTKSLTRAVMTATDPEQTAEQRMRTWLRANATSVQRARATMAAIDQLEEPGLSALSVALGYLRTVARSTAPAG
ncbi:NAD-glutamate dehydrogenase [Georgenia yuyongxinii]|uniref:NAD-glutamate dehydrogenase n=1 Tax=Georgenia yuyongxinii TaxID=2589797 RepID=A0A552WTY9_9MICO|nr:NAD-glutamate dehydrogenase [Georgenia yuyongxinii]TRW46311.1 NAD-glutamate dehydrogenase [Georgenia yuyongxinii]